MKDARTYEKKVRKLLSGMKKRKGGDDQSADPVETLILGVLSANATPNQAARALAKFRKEFVDFNELRVAQPREIVELLGKGYARAHQKAERLTTAMMRLFYRANELSMAYMHQLTKRDLRRHLMEIGLSPYDAAYVTLLAFGGHAIPVDDDLAETLEMDGYVAPASSIGDVQGFLERVVVQKDAVSAHELFRRYVERQANALAKKRKADEAVRLAEEQRRAAEAEAKAKAQAEAEAKAQAKAEAKAKAQAKAKADRKKKKAAKKRPAARRPAAKSPRKKAARKTRKK